MSKAVLVMETPEDCETCALHGGIFHSFCKINCRDIADCNVKPDWCPLKPLPEKKIHTAPVRKYELQKNLLVDGWNACIDAITGEP